MATQTTERPHAVVARAFVEQYYNILNQHIQLTHRFYKDESALTWPQPDGEITSVTTSAKINKFIMSSHLRACKVEVGTIDSQDSAAGGVIVVVTGRLTGEDDSKKSFSQTFFLAQQENGYYVLNDIFKFVAVEEATVVLGTDNGEENVDENVVFASLEQAQAKDGDNVQDEGEIKVTTDDQVGEKSFKAEVTTDDQVVNKASETKVTTDDQVANKLSETKVATDDQVVNKPSITSSEKESVVETPSIAETVAPKASWADMMKQGKPAPTKNVPHRVVRVFADDGLPSAPKKPQPNGLLKALASGNGVAKAATPSTNVAQGKTNNFSNEESECKSIYIGNLPTDVTSSELYSVVKQFGLVHTRDVQLKTYEDGYCCGFVHFQDAVSAQNAVKMHHIMVKGHEAYMRFKRNNKGYGERAKSPSDNRGGHRNDYVNVKENGESRSRPQSSDGHNKDGYQQYNKRKDQRGAKNRGANY